MFMIFFRIVEEVPGIFQEFWRNDPDYEEFMKKIQMFMIMRISSDFTWS